MCILSPLILAAVPRRLCYTFCYLLSGIGVAFFDPKLFGLPEKDFPVTMLGLASGGMSMAPILVSTMPEALEAYRIVKSHTEGKDQYLDGVMTDTFSGLNTLVRNIASIFSPIIGGALYDYLGYDYAILISSIFLGFMALVNLVFNTGFSPYRERREENKILEELKL